MDLAVLLLLTYRRGGAHLPEASLLQVISLEVTCSSIDWQPSPRGVIAMLAAMAVEAGGLLEGRRQQWHCLRIKIVTSTLTMVSAAEGLHLLVGEVLLDPESKSQLQGHQSQGRQWALQDREELWLRVQPFHQGFQGACLKMQIIVLARINCIVIPVRWHNMNNRHRVLSSGRGQETNHLRLSLRSSRP